MRDSSHKIGTTLQPVSCQQEIGTRSQTQRNQASNRKSTTRGLFCFRVICAMQIMSDTQLDTFTNVLIFRSPWGYNLLNESHTSKVLKQI